MHYETSVTEPCFSANCHSLLSDFQLVVTYCLSPFVDLL